MMANLELFNNGTHRNVLLQEFDGHGLAVQTNQHVIVHGDEGMILDPGGHKIYSKVLSETFSVLGRAKLKEIFLSHQDPDIVAALNGWLMTTDAEAHVSALWVRFVPHFGLDRLVSDRLHAIPDEGMIYEMGGAKFYYLPAHFLHSEGNFQVYDPISKILYTGDLGASIGQDYREVTNFGTHLIHMEGFHRRYMTSRSVMRAWADMVRGLDIEIIAPQHGALFRDKQMVTQFIDWCADLECGVDLITPIFRIPTA
ncbi:MAG: MBL fold metallo-hydrolase [Terracidiphilus sp.]|jgi:flavorubredoxin